METLDFVAVASVLMPTLTQLLKTYVFKHLDPRVLSGLVSFSLAFAYALLITYTPKEFLVQLAAFSGIVFGFGTALYKVQKPSKKE